MTNYWRWVPCLTLIWIGSKSISTVFSNIIWDSLCHCTFSLHSTMELSSCLYHVLLRLYQAIHSRFLLYKRWLISMFTHLMYVCCKIRTFIPNSRVCYITTYTFITILCFKKVTHCTEIKMQNCQGAIFK